MSGMRNQVALPLLVALGLLFGAACISSLAESSHDVAQADGLYFPRGINLSGAELNATRTPARYGVDYIYPPTQELDYYAGKGFEVVRLPFRWERVQPSLFGELHEAELARIRNFIVAARAHRMRVILSPHNFGRYVINGRETLIGTPDVPIGAFSDFCRKLALAVAKEDGVYGLSLMNEPHDTGALWKKTAQAGLDAIRSVDRERLVLAPGDQWSGAWSWRRYNANFILNDAANNVIYEAHQYFDFDHSGAYRVASNIGPGDGIELIAPFVEWLRQHNQRGIITEFGVPNDDPKWQAMVERLLAYLADEKIPWTYWAGGPWWGGYPLSTEPKDGMDRPIMNVLSKDYRR